MSKETNKSGGSSAKWLGLVVVILAIVVGGIWIYKLLDQWIDWIIYGFISLLIIIPLFLNRQMVSRILTWIKGTYKKHTALGVLATIGAVLAFLPFSAFLVAKTIWEYFIVKKKKNNKTNQADQLVDSDLDQSADDSIISNEDEPLSNNIDSKFPPTDQ
jgi:hypothetical protein